MNKKNIINKVLKNSSIYSKYTKDELLTSLFNSKDIVNKMSSIREIIKRTTNLELFPVQILGALQLVDGYIIEMKTGEGKTAVALAASLIQASNHKKTHIVTVNEYLAERDADFSRPVYEYINKRCDFIISTTENKKEIYEFADLIYITSSELGFDYLRSNSAYRLEDVCFNNDSTLAIIDEADSILIDEARIPLILSIPKDIQLEDYKKAQSFVRQLNSSDYIVNQKEKTAFLNENGAKKCEKYFKIDDYAGINNGIIRHLIDEALIANFIMKKDIDYLISNDEIKLIDLNTGRIAEGRRFNKGLHQAIEAKENKEIKPETATVGSITFQKLFTIYEKFAGMTGTALSEREEFKDIYNKKIIQIPTNKKLIRKDHPDLIYGTNKDRDLGLINLVKDIHKKNRPILIGTSSIIESEAVADLLNKNGFKFNLLNAKNNKDEADIIKNSGIAGAITISTNMAGRGTDIKLDEESKRIGGLYIIGVGHYDCVRIDNQLRGRAGRQGDPGDSIFLVSVDDELIKVFANDSLRALMKSLALDGNNLGTTHKGFSRGIRKAQDQITAKYFNNRKSTTEYDNILGIYRQAFYKDRLSILTENDLIKLLNKFEKDSNKVLKLSQNILKSNLNFKAYVLNIMDSNWINFLNMAEDLKSESSYTSYSGSKAIVLYEEELSNCYNLMLKNVLDTINKGLN